MIRFQNAVRTGRVKEFHEAFEEVCEFQPDAFERPVGHEIAVLLAQCQSEKRSREMQAMITYAWLTNPSFVESIDDTGVSSALLLASVPYHTISTFLIPYATSEEKRPLFFDQQNRNLFHYAARNINVLRTVTDRDIATYIEMWKKTEMNVNQQTFDTKQTPLHECVRANNFLFARQLISLGASPDMVDEDGMSPLIYAIKIGRGLEVVRELVLGGCATEGLLDGQKHTIQWYVDDPSATPGMRSTRADIMAEVHRAKILLARQRAQQSFIELQRSIGSACMQTSDENDESARIAKKCSEVGDDAVTDTADILNSFSWTHIGVTCTDTPAEYEPSDPVMCATKRLEEYVALRCGLRRNAILAREELFRMDDDENDSQNQPESPVLGDALVNEIKTRCNKLIESIRLEKITMAESHKPKATMFIRQWYPNDHSMIHIRCEMAKSNGSVSPPALCMRFIPNPAKMDREEYPYQDFSGFELHFDWQRYAQYIKAYESTSVDPFVHLEALSMHNDAVSIDNDKFMHIIKLREQDGWEVQAQYEHTVYEQPIEGVPHHELVAEAYRAHVMECSETVTDPEQKKKLEEFASILEQIPPSTGQRITQYEITPILDIFIDLTRVSARKLVVENNKREEEEYKKEIERAYNCLQGGK